MVEAMRKAILDRLPWRLPWRLPRRLPRRLPWGPGRPTVSVLRLSGVIAAATRLPGALSLPNLAQPLERAFAGRGVKAVALVINSPGGSPAQSMLIFERIRALAAEKSIPVFAFAEDAAASGGYMLALAADEIFATDSSIVGSIGVLAASFGFEDLIERLGIERRLYTAGPNKVLLDPFKPVAEDEVTRLRTVLDDMHDAFKELVRARRGDRLKGDEATLFSGAYWTGRQAVGLGLIDGVADIRATMRARFGEDVRFRLIDVERGWRRRRLGFIKAPELASRGIAGEGLAAGSGLRLGFAVEDLLASLEARAWWGRFGL